jgi:hypothetical protein
VKSWNELLAVIASKSAVLKRRLTGSALEMTALK